MSALEHAIEKIGLTPLAQRIGVSPQRLSNWKARESIPPEFCPKIESASGIKCEDLLPGVAWQRDKQGRVTGYVVKVGKAA